MTLDLSAHNEKLENQRYEIINGQERLLAQPATPHLSVSMNLSRMISNYLRGKRCKIFAEPDVFFDEENNFIPDLVVVCDRNKIKYRGIYGAPDLVVEILSPGTAMDDRKEKKAVYEKFGVREYWIIDAKAKSVEVYHLIDGKFELDYVYHDYSEDEWDIMNEKEKAREKLFLKISLYDDFEIDVKEIFEDI